MSTTTRRGETTIPIRHQYEQMIEDCVHQKPKKRLSLTPKSFFFLIALAMLCYLVAFAHMNNLAQVKIYNVLKTLNASTFGMRQSNNSNSTLDESPFLMS